MSEQAKIVYNSGLAALAQIRIFLSRQCLAYEDSSEEHSGLPK